MKKVNRNILGKYLFFSLTVLIFFGCTTFHSPSTSSIVQSEIDPEPQEVVISQPPVMPPAPPLKEASSPQSTMVPPFPIIDIPIEEEEEDEDVYPQGPTYDVPIIINDSVEAYIGYFQVRIRDRFEEYLNRSGRYLVLMKDIFRKNGLPEDLVFVALIESGFNPYAYSRSRAVGPWQFIKGTGRNYGLRIDAWIDERRDPIKSTEAASRYLKDLYTMFGNWPLALASYNAGEGRVKRGLIKTNSEDFWDLKSTRYLKRETRDYVPKFMAATIIAKNPEHYGFNLDYHEPLQFDEVTVDRPTDLRLIAKAVGVSYKELRVLNPELKTTITPPNYKEYQVKIPYGKKEAFLENFSKIPEEQRTLAFRHEVQRGQTLWGLARRYGTTISDLQELNNMGKRARLREGEYLVVPLAAKYVDLGTTRSSAKPTGQKGKYIYQVRKGDTLWRISQEFNVSIKQLKRWNKLSSNRIYPGKRLVLYIKGENL